METARALDVGRYTLHGEIASGGMASVPFGRLKGGAGFRIRVGIDNDVCFADLSGVEIIEYAGSRRSISFSKERDVVSGPGNSDQAHAVAAGRWANRLLF